MEEKRGTWGADGVAPKGGHCLLGTGFSCSFHGPPWEAKGSPLTREHWEPPTETRPFPGPGLSPCHGQKFNLQRFPLAWAMAPWPRALAAAEARPSPPRLLSDFLDEIDSV